jgi:hypothetical protein
MGLSEHLSKLSSLNDRYYAVVTYMENIGFSFIEEKPDHVNNRYRIMENGSSVFVKKNFYRLHLCDEDKKKIDSYPEYSFVMNYKSIKDQQLDEVRPYRYDIYDPELFEKALNILVGKHVESDINIAVPAKLIEEISGEGTVCTCPKCNIRFIKAPRCPECGQLIKYEGT